VYRDFLLKSILSTLIVFGLLIAYASFMLGQTVDKVYYYGLASVPFFLLAGIFVLKKIKEEKFINFIRHNWNKADKRRRNFESIRALFDYLKKENRDFYIDDQTWQDLNMNDIFSVIDRTYSSQGEQSLYYMLRKPVFDEKKLLKRNEYIKLFQQKDSVREQIALALYRVGKNKNNDVTDLLWGELPKQSNIRYLVYFMTVLSLLSIISIPFLKTNAIMLVMLCFTLNMAIHGKVRNTVCEQVNSMGSLGVLINAAKKIGSIREPMLETKIEELKKLSSKCSTISKKTMNVGRIEGIDVIADYFFIMFLLEEVSFFLMLKDIIRLRKELRIIYKKLGELDALISIASYRNGLEHYTEPEFVSLQSTLPDTPSGIEIKAMIHPLLEKPEANSIEIKEGGIIVTGSNMSGKSTFLRTFGVNVLFAQTIYTCLAEKYKGSFLKVITSISPDDSIMGGKSYYLAEAEAILRIIKNCEDRIPCFCIIDEIFRGTNPVERISAAAEILDYLAGHNALTVVATHDIELADMVESHYECYFFSEDVGEEGLVFDYKLKKGVSNTRNAIKLLNYLGYPEEIVKRTNERVYARTV
jgi:DNA mismatch repair ATPase MutS